MLFFIDPTAAGISISPHCIGKFDEAEALLAEVLQKKGTPDRARVMTSNIRANGFTKTSMIPLAPLLSSMGSDPLTLGILPKCWGASHGTKIS